MGFNRNKLIGARKEAGLSQVMLAEKLGLSSGAIGNYESGTRTPKFSTIQLFADYFKVPVAYFLEDSDFVNSRREELVGLFSGAGYKNCSPNVSEELDRIMDLFIALPEKERQKVLGYAEALRDTQQGR